MKFKQATIKVTLSPKTVSIDAINHAGTTYTYNEQGSAARAMLNEITLKVTTAYNGTGRSFEQNVTTDGTRQLLPGP